MINKQAVFEYIQKYKYSIILVVLLFLLSFIFRASIKGINIKSVFWAFMNTLLIISPIIVFSKTILRIPFLILFSLLVTFEAGLFYVYGNPMNYGVVASIAATSISEATDMIKLALPAVFITLCISIFLLYKASIELRQLSWKVPIVSLISFILILFFIPSLLETESQKGEKEVLETANKRNKLFITDLYQKTAPKYPFICGDILVCGAFWEQNRMFNNDLTKDKTLPSGVTYQANSDIDKFILVIGESSTSDNYSLYGYPIKTTPFLDSLSVNQEIFSSFQNVISPASYTIESLKISLSFANPLDLSHFFNHKNIINLAEDAGYKTIWLSSHKKYDSYNSHISAIAMNASENYFQEPDSDDFGLLSPLKNTLKKKEKQFIVVHLYGSHIGYEKRYDEIDEKAIKDHGAYTDYDRSVHHTDRVLSGIYNQIKNRDENIIMYYFSDHGEVINKGHAFVNKWKIQYKIPFIIMQNKPFVSTDSIVNKYYDRETGLLNASSNVFIISELIGYQIADSLIKKSQIEGRYVYQPDGTHCLYNDIKD